MIREVFSMPKRTEKQLLVSILINAHSMMNNKKTSEAGKERAKEIYKLSFNGLIDLYDIDYDKVETGDSIHKKIMLDGVIYTCD